MIPSITPPTDNLYKFISLFGLTIFLFAGYTLNTGYDQLTKSNIEIIDMAASLENFRTKFYNPEDQPKEKEGKEREKLEFHQRINVRHSANAKRSISFAHSLF